MFLTLDKFIIFFIGFVQYQYMCILDHKMSIPAVFCRSQCSVCFACTRSVCCDALYGRYCPTLFDQKMRTKITRTHNRTARTKRTETTQLIVSTRLVSRVNVPPCTITQ